MFCGRSQTSKKPNKWLNFPNEFSISTHRPKKKKKKKNPSTMQMQ